MTPRFLLVSCCVLWMVCWPALLLAGEPVTLWHAYRGEEQRVIEQLAESWNTTHPRHRVITLGIPPEAFVTKLTNAIPRGNGPDLFVAAHERTGEWATSGLIHPLPVGQVDAHSFHPVTLGALEFERNLWGLPMASKSVALFYNTAMIAKEDVPVTTDQLIALALAHTNASQGTWGLVYEAANFYMHAPWYFGFGAEVFDDQGHVLLSTPQAAASFAFASSMVHDHKIVPEDASGSLVSQLFRDGKAAFAINGPWFLGELPKDLSFAIAPLPTVSQTGLPAQPFLTVEALFFATHPEHPMRQEALEFATFLTSPGAAITRATDGKQLVATLAAYKDQAVLADPALMAFRAQLDQSVPMPNRPEMGSVWEPATQALRKVLRGTMEPEEALDQAALRFRTFNRSPPQPRPLAPFLVGGLLLACALAWASRVGWRRQGGWQKARKNRDAYLYLAPAVVGMIALVVVPFVLGSVVSLFAHRQGDFTFVGLANFVAILSSKDYGLTDPLNFFFTMGVTVMWTGVNVFLHVTVGLGFALLLREPWLKLRSVYRVLLIIPWAVPNYITALIWKGMFHKQFGAINGLLSWLGVEPVSWFSHFSTAFAANVATNTWLGFPFMMVVILGALQAIPKDLEEAAEVDGATWWQRMRHVIFPLLRPALVPAVILGTVWTFNMFNIIYLVSQGEPDGSTEILISEAYKWAFTRQHQYGYAAAYAVLIFGVLLTYTLATGQLKLRDR